MDFSRQSSSCKSQFQRTRNNTAIRHEQSIPWFNSIISFIIVGLRPLLGSTHCRYEISCGNYALIQLKHKSLIIALAAIVWRLLSCNPFHIPSFKKKHFLIFLFILSFSALAMETNIVEITDLDYTSWDDFSEEVFPHTSPEDMEKDPMLRSFYKTLLTTPCGRNMLLMHRRGETTGCLQRPEDIRRKYRTVTSLMYGGSTACIFEIDISTTNSENYTFLTHNIPSARLMALVNTIAGMEYVLTNFSSKLDSQSNWAFERTRRNDLILLATICKRDNWLAMRNLDFNEFITTLIKTHHRWPPVHNNTIFNKLSGYTVIKHALEERELLRTNEVESEKIKELWEHQLYFEETME